MKAPLLFPALVVVAAALSSPLATAGIPAVNQVSIEATSPVTAEPAPNILVVPGQFAVRRSGDLSGALVVNLAYRGTATPRADYAPLPERVEFAPGEDSVEFFVLAVDDDEQEDDETVIAILLEAGANSHPYKIDPDHGRATVTINDTDRFFRPPLITIEATVPVTSEPAPNIRVIPGEFTLRRHPDLIRNDLEAPLIVFLSYEGSATPGADYARLPERVEFPAGQDTVTLQVRATDDDEVEDDEIVVASLLPDPTLGPLARYRLDPNRSSARVVIKDTDTPSELPTVSIKATRRIAEETAAPLRRINLVGEFTVSRTGPTTHPLPVWLHVSGTATPGQDYERLPLSVSIPAGERSLSLPLPARFDEVPEGIETVIAEVSNCPPEGLLAPCYGFDIDPACASATVFIREDGLSVATVHITTPSNGERFAAGEPIPIRAVAIHLESYLNHVIFCADGERIGESEIQFIRAPDPGTPITHEFVWQRAGSGPHTLTAKALLPGREPNLADQTIVSSPVRITVGDAPPNHEPAGAIQAPQSGDVFPAGDPIRIRVEARDPDGYIPTVEFFADGLKIGEQNIAFLIPPPPGQAQTFTFEWEHPMPGPHRLHARLTDNQGASAETSPVEIVVTQDEPRSIITVVARDALAVEPGNNRPADTATFRIRRHGPTTGDLTVHYSLHGRAENGVDYERLSGTVVLPDGSRGADVTVVPLADQERERGESVILRLEEDSAYRLDHPRRAAAVIRDAPMPEPPAPPRCIRLADGLIHLCFPADDTVCFRVESSSNLRDWTTLFCLVAIDGSIHLVHERSAGFPGRFFRIAPEPDGLLNE